MDKVSEFISYEEATRTSTGLDNTPTVDILKKMTETGKAIFDPVRRALGAMRVNCFYRSPEVNKAVGGAPKSQHAKGEAIDMSGLNGLKNSAIFNHIKENLEFDQLIAENITNGEPKWIHCSWVAGNKRNQILVAIPKESGGWNYVEYKKGMVNE